MDEHLRMNKVIGAHNNKVEIAKTIDEITNHSHVIRVALPIQTVYASSAGDNCSAVVEADMPPVEKVRQRPVRAFGKIPEGVKCFDAIAVEISHRRVIKQTDTFHADNRCSADRALKSGAAASSADLEGSVQSFSHSSAPPKRSRKFLCGRSRRFARFRQEIHDVPLQVFPKMKAPKRVWHFGLFVLFAIQQAIGGRVLLLCQVKTGEFSNEIIRSEYSVSVEISTCLFLRWHGHIQGSSRSQYASQFFTGAVSSLSVEGITVSTQADVLHY